MLRKYGMLFSRWVFTKRSAHFLPGACGNKTSKSVLRRDDDAGKGRKMDARSEMGKTAHRKNTGKWNKR